MTQERLSLPTDQTNAVTGSVLFSDANLHRAWEEAVRPNDRLLVAGRDDTVMVVSRNDFLPAEGYLVHFNIATAKNPPHIEPLPRAHHTISAASLCMVEGQKQYVLEMEVAVIGALREGIFRPMYIGTMVDFGDRTPRIDGTGRTLKTWTTGIEYGGSTGISTSWVEVADWSEIDEVEMEYWVYDRNHEVMLHTPNARADSLKLWGQRLGDWVGAYPPVKLQALGIAEGIPFLLSTGQILYEDDGDRSISPAQTPEFTARALMKIADGKYIETVISGHTLPRSEETFNPVYPPFSYYE